MSLTQFVEDVQKDDGDAAGASKVAESAGDGS